MKGLVLALCAAYGTFLLYTALAFGWRGLGPQHERRFRLRLARRFGRWLASSGIEHLRPGEAVAVFLGLFGIGAALAWALFGGFIPPMAGGAFAAALPLTAARTRRERRQAEASEAWPQLIEELRIKTTALGRSIPQALFEVGRHAPEELCPAFEEARREWLISTDFERSLALLTSRLANATADTVCETLLVANDIGGAEIDRCLTALIDDRVMDQQGRKDARAGQAGARFARRFVVVVPLGMALVGLSIGEGRAAYQSAGGQVMVLVALALMGACWVWAGRIMRLPVEARVFVTGTGTASVAGGTQ